MGILTNCRRACVIALLALAVVVGGYAQAFSLEPGTLGFFESSFVLADAYMATSYVTSAVLLLLQKPLAVPVGIAAGSSSIYLGCMDLLYDLQHDKFRDFTPSMAFETTIIATSFVLGAVTIVRFWLSKDRLEEASAQ